jgi:hypothetical protein
MKLSMGLYVIDSVRTLFKKKDVYTPITLAVRSEARTILPHFNIGTVSSNLTGIVHVSPHLLGRMPSSGLLSRVDLVRTSQETAFFIDTAVNTSNLT